jgi:hypothetical protein
MSMIGNFLLLSDQRLSELLANPEQVHDACDDGYEAGDEVFVDVDKAWHCIHFLLTGTSDGGNPPLNFVMAGGREVGDEDVGYGPARALMAHELQELARALDLIDQDTLVRRFDPAMMDRLEIYPDAGRWSEVDPKSEDSFGYYLGGFDSLKVLIQRGAAAGSGMLVWLS